MSRLATLVVLLLACWRSFAQDEPTLVRAGDRWHFFKAAVEPPGAPGDWTRLGYTPGPEWLTGRSGIGTYVGGRDAENVLLYDRNYNYVAVCFRKEFVLTDPATLRWLTLRIDYQEGFVAYLNGIEFLRVGLAGNPGEPVPVTTLAATRLTVRPVEFPLTAAAIGALRPGTNVLAIQVHTDRVGPGFPFSPTTGDLLCLAELLGNFDRGPHVQNVSTTAAHITWKSRGTLAGVVEFGTSPGELQPATSSTAGVQQDVELTGLQPDTLYHYRVKASDGTTTAVSPLATFRTFRESGDISFCVLGDSGGGTDSQYLTAELMRARRPDLVLHCGDIIYNSFDPFRTDTRCISVYGPHMRSTPYFFTLGNHDMYYDRGASAIAAFSLPTNLVSADLHLLDRTTPEHYYSFDHGDVHFVCLFNPLLSYYDFRPGTAQYAWLEQDLLTTRKKWKVLFQHMPVHTSGPHIYDETNFNGTNDVEDLRNAIFSIATRTGLDLVLTGHDHLYERFAPDRGTHCVVTGAGGVLPLYGPSLLDPLSAKLYIAHHHLFAQTRGDSLTIQAIGTNGVVFDEFVIQKSPPPPKTYQADWAALKFPSIGADDLDGNLFGQSWPFAEVPEATVQSSSGQFVNLGRLRVSTDTTNLFIGLERTMLPPAADVAVFLQVPGVPGIQSMVSVGNGIADPDGQGVDGLDFLKHLSFTNFTPSFACLLGDEYADGTVRNFLRTDAANAGGQGVFRLNTTLDTVASARVQQFNLLRQTVSLPGEANADYMVVSIPCAALGNLRPLDELKIAVIAARDITDTNAPVREIDTGFVGLSMTGSGTNAVVLEGVTFRLPPDGDPDGDSLPTTLETVLGTDPQNPDTDNDGLGDLWEVSRGLNPKRADGANGPGGDPDQDLLTNLDEFRLGTDPLRAGPRLPLKAQPAPGGKLRVTWPSLVGSICVVESAEDVRGPFVMEAEVAPRDVPEAEFVTDIREGARFFRLRLRVPGL